LCGGRLYCRIEEGVLLNSFVGLFAMHKTGTQDTTKVAWEI